MNRSTWLRSFTEIVGVIVPSVREIPRGENRFPQVSALYHSLMWAFLPMFLWWSVRSVGRRDGWVLRWNSPFYRIVPPRISERIAMLAFLVFALGLVGAAWMFYDGRSVILFPFGESRLFLGIAGLVVELAVAMFLVLAWYALRRVLSLSRV